ncbi:Plant self-incompatibility response [Arabidopsis thaliana x Arabidopsis arenosa]|uniref:Plant self-incompatibility response n=1 Tax=Arabidopsis thaliana x Arabidopsis arenosa TaxID=1240361 RepID=A0A8T2AUX4_9BRAS|nr:Plant self-incompatibility response [Arabidopsis thaliana x Arabidopsis arenosa]
MKSTTLFMVSCVFMFYVLSHVREVKSVAPKRVKKVCEKSQVFKQNCGWNGNKTCIRGFNKIKEYPFHCECGIYDELNSRRLCKCKFPYSPC